MKSSQKSRHLLTSLPAILAAGLGLALAVSSCSIWVSPGSGSSSGTITGKVLDARTGYGISGVTVTASDSVGDSYSGTTGTSGAWTLTASVEGTYTITVTDPNALYTFTTPTVATVLKSGATVASQTIAGISNADIPSASEFSCILVWNGNPSELQLHLSMPNGNFGTHTMTANTVESPNWIPTTTNYLTDWALGFGPNGNNSSGALSSTGRIIVGPSGAGFSNQTQVLSGSTTIVKMDQDSTTGGPSTITVSDFPVATTTGYSITPDTYNKFASADTLFLGVAELYASAPSGSLSTLTTSANAAVYIMVNTGKTAPECYGAYTVPTNTSLTTVSIARINIMDAEFQIIPDISVVPDGAYRAVTAANSTSGVISIPRKSK